jgi:hypothetical protein
MCFLALAVIAAIAWLVWLVLFFMAGAEVKS